MSCLEVDFITRENQTGIQVKALGAIKQWVELPLPTPLSISALPYTPVSSNMYTVFPILGT